MKCLYNSILETILCRNVAFISFILTEIIMLQK